MWMLIVLRIPLDLLSKGMDKHKVKKVDNNSKVTSKVVLHEAWKMKPILMKKKKTQNKQSQGLCGSTDPIPSQTSMLHLKNDYFIFNKSHHYISTNPS
jgi:hypothetical protein